MGHIERDHGLTSELPRQQWLACFIPTQFYSIGADSKVPAKHHPEPSMRKHVALPVLFSNQAPSPVLFLFVQPLRTSLQTAWRPVELNPPEMNSLQLEAGVAMAFKTREVLN
jgi:hypothetical protein